MRVLHILSQIEMTGAEAYVVTLSEWLIAQGCDVTLVSDKLHLVSSARFIPRTIHKPSLLDHLNNIFFLRRFIQTEKIQIVHCHSRAAIRAGYWATRGLSVALVSTIHGRQHASISKRLFDMYGDRVIGVCKNVLKNLQESFKMSARKMICVGNPVKMNSEDFGVDIQSRLRLAVISRSSGPKGQRTKDLIYKTLPKLLEQNPHLHIDIIGGVHENLDQHFAAHIFEVNNVHGNRLHLLGYISNLHERFDDYRLIIGSGRIPIETLSRGILSYAIGEYSCEGLVTAENYEKLKESNFGDIGAQELELPIDYEKITHELNGILQQNPVTEDERRKLCEFVRSDFSIENTCSEVLDLYRSTYFRKLHPQHIPILMYHKVPDTEFIAQHRIFITKYNFEKHLQFFKKKKFTTISFKELEEFRSLKNDPRNFPKKPLIITFDDGYADNLFNAGPLLRQYGMKATIFLLADETVRSNFWDKDSGDPEHLIMSIEEKRQLLEYPFEIGSHGFKHEKITSLSATQAYDELAHSKKILQERLGVSINTFAFTYGITAPWAARLAQKAGYTFAVNTDTGGLHIEENPHAIFRTTIFPEDGPAQLRKKTSKWYRQYFFIKRKK